MSQGAREEPRYWRDRDPEENASGRLPEGEDLQLGALWVAELYTPATVLGLLDGIRGMGWEFSKTHDESLMKWMNDVREGRQAGWMSLGLVSPRAKPHFMADRTANLPSGVRAAVPVLMSITPSITAFVSLFLLEDEAAESISAPLRQTFMTSTRRDSRFRSWHVLRYVLWGGTLHTMRHIDHPDMKRRLAARAAVREMESRCTGWVRDNLPGVFSGVPGAGPPTAALLISEHARPLTAEAKAVRAFGALGLDRDFDSWESEEWPGVRVVLPDRWDDDRPRLVFACRRHDAFPDERGYADPTSNWSMGQRADDHVRGLLSRWALSELLDRYHESLAALRDRTARDGSYRPVRDLKSLRSLVRTTLYDIGVSAQEIADFANSKVIYRWDVMELTYCRKVGGETLEFVPDMQERQAARAQQVLREEKLLRSALSTSSHLTQSVSNVRIQRLLVVLTIASIGIALWAAFLSLSAKP